MGKICWKCLYLNRAKILADLQINSCTCNFIYICKLLSNTSWIRTIYIYALYTYDHIIRVDIWEWTLYPFDSIICPHHMDLSWNHCLLKWERFFKVLLNIDLSYNYFIMRENNKRCFQKWTYTSYLCSTVSMSHVHKQAPKEGTWYKSGVY